MKMNYLFRLPEESILGFKVLSSLQSTISVYILMFSGILLNPFFGTNNIQIIAGSIFNVVLNLSLLILILNLIKKRNQLKKKYFYLINSVIFIFMPHIFIKLFENLKILIT